MSYAVTRYELATYRIAGGTSCLPLRASFSPIHASKVDGNKKQELVPTELHEWHVFTRRPDATTLLSLKQTISCKRSSLCLGSDFGNPCFLTVLTSGWMDKITNFFSCAVGHSTTGADFTTNGSWVTVHCNPSQALPNVLSSTSCRHIFVGAFPWKHASKFIINSCSNNARFWKLSSMSTKIHWHLSLNQS